MLTYKAWSEINLKLLKVNSYNYKKVLLSGFLFSCHMLEIYPWCLKVRMLCRTSTVLHVYERNTGKPFFGLVTHWVLPAVHVTGKTKEKIWVPDTNRTHDLLVKRQALYPLSYESFWRARSFMYRIEHLPRFWEVVGVIPVFVPLSCHIDQFNFPISLLSLKFATLIIHLSKVI